MPSFASAARKLDHTHSAISQQIRSLEDFIGQPLFVREGGGSNLTDAGHAYLADCVHLLAAVDAAEILAVPVFEDRSFTAAGTALDGKANGALTKAAGKGRFTGKAGQSLSIAAPAGVEADAVLRGQFEQGVAVPVEAAGLHVHHDGQVAAEAAGHGGGADGFGGVFHEGKGSRSLRPDSDGRWNRKRGSDVSRDARTG